MLLKKNYLLLLVPLCYPLRLGLIFSQLYIPRQWQPPLLILFASAVSHIFLLFRIQLLPEPLI